MKLRCDASLPNLAFNFKLRRYVKELKQYIESHGGDTAGAVEKAELVARAKACPAGGAAGTAGAAAPNVPEGYVRVGRYKL